IDSGADLTLIPLSLGKLLGLELKKEDIHELRGVGERAVPVVIREINIKIGEHRIKTRTAWALIEDVPPLLGRLDIFDNFHVHFRQDQRAIEFEKIKAL
ncbi:MAG: aspartyl protease family protein, partial [Candidatus Thermoplasmatota archaeon]